MAKRENIDDILQYTNKVNYFVVKNLLKILF